MARKGRKLTQEELERNEKRLAEVNEFLSHIDLDVWDVKDVASISGYIIGVFMTLRSTGYTICSANLEQIREIEREQPKPVPF